MGRMTRLLLVCAAIAAQMLTAQTVIVTGSLRGQITDPSGAVIAAAQVELLEERTGSTSRQMTKHAGIFVFPALASGQYSMKASASGFQTSKIHGLTVQVGET